MKSLKFLIAIFAFLAITISTEAQTRFGTTANSDNTGRALTYKYQAPAYASTIAVTLNAYETIIKPAALTGNVTFNATVTSSKIGDKVYFMFSASAADRTVTFGTNFTPTATLVVDSGEVATATFMYNGSKFIELGRAKQ